MNGTAMAAQSGPAGVFAGFIVYIESHPFAVFSTGLLFLVVLTLGYVYFRMHDAWLILATKLRNTVNHFKVFLKRNPWQAGVAVMVGVLFVCSLFGFFYWLFDLLEEQEPFGAILVNRMLGMIFLSFFTMLIFSNVIVTLSTTYLSAELDFMMSSPMRYSSIFLVKFIESILYSSWALLFFSAPMFVALMAVRELSWTYLVNAILFIIPFLIIPAALGATLTMFLAAFFPARRTRILVGALGFATVVLLVFFVRFSGGNELITAARAMRYDELIAFMHFGANPFLPSRWLGDGLLAAAEGNAGDLRHYFLTMLSSAGMAVLVCFMAVPGFYYRGWTLAKESESARTTGPRIRLFIFLEPLLWILPRPMRGLVKKDVMTFWRDPTQWSQFVLVFGLLAIYVTNMRQSVVQMLPFWRYMLIYFNLGVTSFVLSILTTRFVYPLPSLEGRQYWIVGLAPIKKTMLIWQKYFLCLLACLSGSVSLIALSNHLLGVEAKTVQLSFITMICLSFGLTSLAVGLGSAFANFKDDNPARIANSPGGTLNMVVSLLYVLAVILILAYPNYMQMTRLMVQSELDRITMWSRIAFITLNGLMIILPMAFGLRRWNRRDVIL